MPKPEPLKKRIDRLERAVYVLQQLTGQHDMAFGIMVEQGADFGAVTELISERQARVMQALAMRQQEEVKQRAFDEMVAVVNAENGDA